MENKQSAQYERQEPLNLYDEYVERINMQREAAIIKIAESRQIDFAESPNRALVEAALIGWFGAKFVSRPFSHYLQRLALCRKVTHYQGLTMLVVCSHMPRSLKKSTAVIASECLTALEARALLIKGCLSRLSVLT